jgi:hypothetical protein
MNLLSPERCNDFDAQRCQNREGSGGLRRSPPCHPILEFGLNRWYGWVECSESDQTGFYFYSAAAEIPGLSPSGFRRSSGDAGRAKLANRGLADK